MARPRILFVSPSSPNPRGRGIEQRAFQQLDALARLGDVTLVLPDAIAARAAAEGVDLSALPVARLVTRPQRTRVQVRRAALDRARDPLTRLWHLARLPDARDTAALAADVPRVRASLGPDRFDLAFAFRMVSALWLESLGLPPAGLRLFDLDDIESVAARRGLDGPDPTRGIWRWRYAAHARWLARTEARLIAAYDATLVCSEGDRAKLPHPDRLLVIPNGVPFGDPPPPAPPGPFQGLFVGTLSYRPNAEGLRWFVAEAWPRVRGALPDARLAIVGIDPPADIAAMDGQGGIVVHGRVPDVAPHYAAAHATIAPIFAGGGTRIKIVEAFARARPVVSTTIGAEGLEAAAGIDLLLADDAECFAAALVRLAGDRALAERLALAGHAHGAARFSRAAAQARLLDWIAPRLSA